MCVLHVCVYARKEAGIRSSLTPPTILWFSSHAFVVLCRVVSHQVLCFLMATLGVVVLGLHGHRSSSSLLTVEQVGPGDMGKTKCR